MRTDAVLSPAPPDRLGRALLRPAFLFALLLGSVTNAAMAAPAIEVEITTPKATYGLNDPVPTSITIRNTTPPASGDDSAVNDAANQRNTARGFTIDTFTLQGRDIYGNRVNVVVQGFVVGDVGPGITITRNYDFTIPNDGTLHDVNDPGYSIRMAYRFTDPATPPVVVRGAVSTFQDILISVRPDLALNTITYTAGSYRGGDVLTYRAVITNNRNGEPSRQGRPLRPTTTDQYRLDTRLSIAPAFDENLPNEFNLFLADLAGDQGWSVPPNQRTTIRQIRVINTPGTALNPTIPAAYGVLRPATATVAVGPGGVIVGTPTIDSAGAGYAVGDTVTLQGGQITGGALFSATVTTVDVSGGITALTPVAAGAGYVAGTYTLVVTAQLDRGTDRLGRNYNPQPADGFLDLGETLEVVFEVRMPDNWPGVYFVCGQVDSLGNLVEPRPAGNEVPYPDTVDEGGEPRRVNNNTFVSSRATRVIIESTASPITELVSGLQATSAQPANFSNNASDIASVSGSGQWVAFASFADNLLTTGRTLNGRRQIYIRQSATREINLASANDAGVEGNGNSYNPAISANGRYVAFESAAANLVPRDFNGSSDIFVRDIQENRTVRVSMNSRGLEANAASFNPSISADGRFVAFESKARNLDTSRSVGAAAGSTLVYVHNRAVDPTQAFDQVGNTATYLVSVSLADAPANSYTYFARVSGDGTSVAYVSYALNLPGGTGYEQVYRVGLDADGAPLASSTELVSKSGAAVPGNGPSYQPSINDNGTQIAFTSDATNLVANDTNGVADIFVRNRSAGRTVRVSVSNPRLASGEIIFYDPLAYSPFTPAGQRGLAPANNPANGDQLTIGTVTFTFRNTPLAANDVAIGVNGGATRDNLVTAINASTLDVTASASTPPPAGNPKAPYSPAVYLLANTPGTAGNLPVTYTPSNPLQPVIFAVNMTGGGTEANDPEGLPNGVPSGSITPSISADGRYVAFRSVADNLVVAEPTPENNFLKRGDLIRPQLGFFSDIYVHDRDFDGDKSFDEAGAVNTEIVSVNTFGNNTGALLGQQSSGNNQMPSISADGRFIGFSSDSENRAGLIFGGSNLVPQDTNRFRDVFLRNRNLVGQSTPPTNVSTLKITSPSTDRSYVTGSVVLLNADVKPAKGKTITQVQFVVNGTVLATITTAPYTANLPLTSPGTYDLTVIATDNFGVQTSDFRRITAQAPIGEAPSSSVVHPTPGGNGDVVNDFSVASTFYLNTIAVPGNNATVKSVKFFANGELIAGKVTRLGDQYGIFWRPRAQGNYNITSEVTDSRGNTVVTAPLQFIIGEVSRPLPSITMRKPGISAGTRAGSEILLEAEYNANGLTPVARVDFYANGVYIGAWEPGQGTSPLKGRASITWIPSEQGRYQISARVMQVLGEIDNSIVSNVQTISVAPKVDPDGLVPIILFSDPVTESTLVRGSGVFLNITATDPDGTIANKGVSILVDGQKLQEPIRRYGDTWSVKWIPQQTGLYTIQATAEDDRGNISVLPQTQIEIIEALRLLPVVTIENIVAGSQISTSQPVTLQARARFPANASDESRVDFYANGVLLGTGVPGERASDGFTQYTFEWQPESAGTVKISAKATALNYRTQAAVDSENYLFRYGSTLSKELEPVKVLDVGAPAPGTPGAFVKESYERLLYEEPLYEVWKFYVDRLENGRMDEADVVMSIMGYDPAAEKFNYRTPYGRTSAMAFAPYARLGLAPNNNLIGFFLSTLQSDDTLLPITVYPAPNLAPPPYGATVGLGKAMQDIFESRVFLQRYPAVTALSQENFVLWLRDKMFPNRPLGRLELISGTSSSPGLMDLVGFSEVPDGEPAQPVVGDPYEEGAAAAFLSRLVVASYSKEEAVFQRQMNVSALLFQLSGRWDLNAYKTYGLYSKQAVQKILASLSSPIGGNAVKAPTKKQQLAKLAGTYAGKLSASAAKKWTGGDLSIVIGKSGAVSGTLKVNGRTLEVTGMADSSGKIKATTLPVPGYPTFALNLSVQNAGTIAAKLVGDVRSGAKSLALRAPVVKSEAVAQKLRSYRGGFEGLVHRAKLNGRQGGGIRLNITASGAVSGQIIVSGKPTSFLGRVDVNGRIEAVNGSKSAPKQRLVLQIDRTNLDKVSGAVSAGQEKATVRAHRSPWSKQKPAKQYAGELKLAFDVAPTVKTAVARSLPGGVRSAVLKVRRDGWASLSGKLGKNAPLNWSGRLTADGRLMIQASIRGHGSVMGTVRFKGTKRPLSVVGSLEWVKLPKGKDKGFDADLTARSLK